MIEAHDCACNIAYETESSSVGLASPTAHWDARQEQRRAATSADAASSVPFDLASLWLDACAGKVRIVDTFFDAERCYALVSRRASEARRRPISERRLRVLERVLLGARAKVVAMELSLSPSSVAGSLAYCLRALGFGDRPYGLPLMLVMAVRAARREIRFEARCSRLKLDLAELEVVSALRPDLGLGTVLSGAELAVTSQIVEGCDHDEIARARGTSPRTVANQLGAAYRKLGVSGRAELIDQVVSSLPPRAGLPPRCGLERD
jgi:DNA-binding NarL/FixJ family response regulator